MDFKVVFKESFIHDLEQIVAILAGCFSTMRYALVGGQVNIRNRPREARL